MTRKIFGAALAVLFACSMAVADELVLRDGSVIKGTFISGNQTAIVFDFHGEVEAFPIGDVATITFTAPEAPPAAPPAAASESTAQAAPAATTVPAGTRLVIRMTNDLDSSRHSSGHKFTAKLEGDLVANGEVVAPQGSTVYGQLVSASSARRLAGRSEMTIVLTDVMINNQLVPITTSEVRALTEGTGGDTARKVATGAAIGALAGGSRGARGGAKWGAGAAILTRGNQIFIPGGTLLEFSLGAALTP